MAIFLTHGAVFLALKTSGTIRDRAHEVGKRTGLRRGGRSRWRS